MSAIQKPPPFSRTASRSTHDDGYMSTSERIRWMPNAAKADPPAQRGRLFSCSSSHQSGVARGYFSEDELNVLHDWMRCRTRRPGPPLSTTSGIARTIPPGTVAGLS